MKRALTILILSLLFVLSYTQDEETDDVVVLTSENFNDVIDENEFVFVEFYAPWCGHCKKLAPEYSKLATQLKEEGSDIVIAKVDATVESNLAQEHGVRGYPTLKFFREGSPVPFEGDRTASGMKTWLERKSGPASRELKSAEDLENFLAQAGGKVLGFFDNEESKDFGNYIKAASSGQAEEHLFGHVFGDVEWSDEPIGTIRVFTSDGKEATYEDDKITKRRVIKFIDEFGYPLVPELEQKVFQRASISKTPLLTVFCEESAENTELLEKIAKRVAEQGISVTVGYVKDHGKLAERWGASGDVFPTGIMIDFSTGQPQFSVFNEEDEEFTEDTAVDFAFAVLEGTYKSYRKSEPIPESNDEPVTVVVGKNFEEIVFDKEKDVLVEFYAPWCGHCKKLAPIYEELGEEFADKENIVIAKIDATANNFPDGIQVQGYPTLIFFPANNKNGIKFQEQNRDFDTLLKFVTENADTLSEKTDL